MHKIKNIVRFPIKGLSGEYLESINLIENEVLPGDREFAFARYNLNYDENNPIHFRKNNFLALVKEEKLANLKTSFDPKTRHLVIKLENNILINDFLVNQQSIQKVEIFFQEYLNLPVNEKPNLIQGLKLKNNNDLTHSFSDIPEKAISIINMNSIIELEKKINKTIDPLRFRANFLIDGGKAWEEFDWIGKKIQIGKVVLEVFKRTQRCAATIVNPENGQRDIDIPKEISKNFGHVDLGVYAKVIKNGEVSVSDNLFI